MRPGDIVRIVDKVLGIPDHHSYGEVVSEEKPDPIDGKSFRVVEVQFWGPPNSDPDVWRYWIDTTWLEVLPRKFANA